MTALIFSCEGRGKMERKKRCPWCEISKKMVQYHDKEWGTPIHSDRKHFEFISLEVMQCGLNWNMMIEKRNIIRNCFDRFDYKKISKYDDNKVSSILNYPGMIKSIKKINAIINNSKCFLEIIKEFGSFDNYIWSFSNGKSIIYTTNRFNRNTSSLSDMISSDMKKRGFKYLGSITIYAHLEACGIINDHSTFCWKYQDLANDCIFLEN
jgi:DNA-3-methyladenine glycosylase I